MRLGNPADCDWSDGVLLTGHILAGLPSGSLSRLTDRPGSRVASVLGRTSPRCAPPAAAVVHSRAAAHWARKLTKCFADRPVCPAKASIPPAANDCKHLLIDDAITIEKVFRDGLDVFDTPIEYDFTISWLGAAKVLKVDKL